MDCEVEDLLPLGRGRSINFVNKPDLIITPLPPPSAKKQNTPHRWFTTSAFVHQHEMLHPYLTPRETLQFHATARCVFFYSLGCAARHDMTPSIDPRA